MQYAKGPLNSRVIGPFLAWFKGPVADPRGEGLKILMRKNCSIESFDCFPVLPLTSSFRCGSHKFIAFKTTCQSPRCAHRLA